MTILMSPVFVLFQLAKRGMKVALISRSKEKLDQVAGEISELKTSFLNVTCVRINKINATTCEFITG